MDAHRPCLLRNVFTFLGRGYVNAADEGAWSMREAQLCVCVCAVVDEVGELGYKSVLPFLTFSGAMLLFVVFRFCAILL